MKKIAFLFLFAFFLFPSITQAVAVQCTSSADCQPTEYCKDFGAGDDFCEAKVNVGEICTASIECLSNNCPSGRCLAPASAAGASSTGAPSTGQYDLPNFLGTDEPADIVGRVIKTIIGFCGILALIMFIYGGITWLISFGREQYIEKGKDTMIWSAIGLAVVFGSYILVNFVFSFFGK